MKYLARKTKKLIKKITRTDEGDGYRQPYRTADDRLKKSLSKISRGGKIEKSHKKKVGEIANPNTNKYMRVKDTVAETLKRIEDIYSSRKKKKR
jgi:hypothetical protein